MFKIARAFFAAALLPVMFQPNFVVSSAAAHDASTSAEIILGSLVLSGPFTRAMAPTAKAGGGYLTITNKGSEPDRLVSAVSPMAPVVQLHEMKMVESVMKMSELPNGIDIPAGGTVSLAPGGLHVMFMNVPKPFVEGEMVPVVLTFEKAGSVEVMFKVEAISATAPAGGHVHQ